MNFPLEGVTVLDFTQLLSGPLATLRLADLGARIIKVEHKDKGDLSRSLYGESVELCGDSAFFQAINRNKESLELNLKDPQSLEFVYQLVQQVDVVTHNFRPGVMQRLGLDYEILKQHNPKLIYASVSGYGADGPLASKPGQDLLVQAMSAFVWQSGNDEDGPVPVGLALADMFAGGQLVQGILAALVSGESTEVEVSMLEAMLDFQFEPLTLFYQDGGQPVVRGDVNGAHPLVAAPYGLYQTQNGFMVLAMGSISKLAELLESDALAQFDDPTQWYPQRDKVKQVLKNLLLTNTTQHWLSILEPADIWCAEVLDWQQMLQHDGFKVLDMLQTVECGNGQMYQTTRCPIRIDGEVFKSEVGAPVLGQHNHLLQQEFSYKLESNYEQ
ncbi:CaiB/BaiF CoA-transferase family protein [Vibrio sp. CK2-1]|uniref:CaiB/BaiF CoA transferase family protein n=1 Tax=Vibrio sp. CK2-1 TaxID=2912249 RepID=UPI001F4865F4|nr:CaiB/BaiF CoA-transferase family protein [Vibrio sp. CK2-1]MCF7352970.1 CoA transferase [Vibrio sp. CK2-1]